MEIASLITGPVGVNTYIVYGKNAGECIIIDPSDTELVNKKLDELGVKPTAVLLTHGHFDHIVSVADLQKQYGARVYIHEIDEAGLRDASVNLCAMAHIDIPPCNADVKLKGGETIHEAGFDIRVLYTPGHTKGGICLYGGGCLFSGDTLFASSVGRTDLPGGDYHEILHSVNVALAQVADETKVYPGHGPASRMGRERRCNPYLQQE